MTGYRNCGHCGWEYVPRHSNDTHCNLCRVANQMTDKSRNERKRVTPRGICEVCNGPISGRRSRKTCSDTCNQIRINRYEKERRDLAAMMAAADERKTA